MRSFTSPELHHSASSEARELPDKENCPWFEVHVASPDVDVEPLVSAAHGRPLPGSQPPFGLVEKVVNLLLVVASPQAGGLEYLVPDLRSCHRGSPYPQERVANGLKEGINLLGVIARQQR